MWVLFLFVIGGKTLNTPVVIDNFKNESRCEKFVSALKQDFPGNYSYKCIEK